MLREIPPRRAAWTVDTLVIDDGSADATSEVARGGGAYVVRLERNCGHGVALRVGYRLAREHGARFLVTLDARRPVGPSELPRVLEPVVAGEADFAIGSRVLGAAETDDAFRQAGVHVFGALVRLLTGSKVTDTSSGFRAMRVEVTETVRRTRSVPDVGAAHRRARPGVPGGRATDHMRKRMAGQSKKGHNVLYGMRYARVILTTWARERRRA